MDIKAKELCKAKVIERQGGRCFVCNEVLNENDTELHHTQLHELGTPKYFDFETDIDIRFRVAHKACHLRHHSYLIDVEQEKKRKLLEVTENIVYVTPQELSEAMGIEGGTIRRWCKKNNITRRLGRNGIMEYCMSNADIEAFKNRNKARGRPKIDHKAS